MVSSSSKARLPHEVKQVLARLRWRIRGYVWLSGLAAALVWLVLAFWCALAIDYLPVLVGASEMPRAARAVLLVLTAAGLAVIVYRWILRRIFVPLRDRSLAILVERRYGDFDDALITSVELADHAEESRELTRVMLEQTRAAAMERLPIVRPRDILNWRPLSGVLAIASLMCATLIVFYAVNSQGFERGLERLYLLSDQPWPRRAQIKIVGLEVRREETALQAGLPLAAVRPFLDYRVKVARGSDLCLVVQADAVEHVAPETCTVTYQTDDGDRGRVKMVRVGQVQDGLQIYKYDARPFKEILTGVTFDVTGFDHRLPTHYVEVVDSPMVVDCRLDCTFPSYMVDEQLGVWLPRSVPLSTGTSLPWGTEAVLRAEANKPLERIIVRQERTGRTWELAPEDVEGERRGFSLTLEPLSDQLALEVVLVDQDGLVSDRPYRVYVTAVPDEPPALDVVLKGISTAVTPDVLLPLKGSIQDDYGVQKAWVEVTVNDQVPVEIPIELSSEGDVEEEVDFREQRRIDSALQLKPEDRLQLVVKASDRYDLEGGPQIGTGDHYALDVVTADQLLAMLEAREIGLRQRFEQMVEEVRETRDMLLRVRAAEPLDTLEPEPDPTGNDSTVPEDEEDDNLQAIRRSWSLRLLRAQQALLQSQKSAQETLGVAASFRDIREELINNRVDTEDRKERLENQLEKPLERIGNEMFPKLDQRLRQLITLVEQRAAAPATETLDDPTVAEVADQSVAQINAILLAMNGVLQNMLELESYNELLDIVRSLIEEQEQLLNETKKQQKKQVLDLLQ